MQVKIDVVLDYLLAEPADVLLQIEVAQMADQRLLSDRLTASSAERLRPIGGEDGIGQRTWVAGEGLLHVTYQALVEIERPVAELAALTAVPPGELPSEIIRYLFPSRYVEAERFEAFAESRFGAYAGGAKIQAMLDWFDAEMVYDPGSGRRGMSAAATFIERRGVCRDYAHLLIALARVQRIPARMVSAYAPHVTPQDFHAVAELWLSGGWHPVDPTGMAKPGEIVRIAAGRDATDVAFMTIFGHAEMQTQSVKVRRSR